MKRRFSFIITLWWVLLLGFLGGMIIWLAPKEERVSLVENRNLAGAPNLSYESVIDSSFMSGVEIFLADGFFKRIKLIELSSTIKGIFNIKSADEILDVDMEQAVNEFMDEAESENQEKVSDLSNENEESVNAGDEQSETNIENSNDNTDSDKECTFWLDLSDGGTRTVYTFSKENMDISIAALNAYRQVLPEDGEVHFFQIPYGYLANLLIYDDDNKYTGWGCDAEDYMQNQALEGVYLHNGAEILEPYLLEEEELYFRTDYHWSTLGAYYGQAGIRKDMGLPYVEFDDYKYKVYEDFIGAGYGENPSAEIRAKADRLDVIYPMFPAESYTMSNVDEESEAPLIYYNYNAYTAYLGGTIGPWRRIITGADTGRECLIITDSFGNIFAPYMFAYYDEVHMVDLRPAYFSMYKSKVSVKEYIEHYGVDDVYIMLSTSSSMNSAYMLNYLMKYLDY